eukprot:m.386266 g.386266  ORF g.386266 m.386266 type:complete len:244 (+) comp21014_c0_seq5:68-799(+)
MLPLFSSCHMQQGTEMPTKWYSCVPCVLSDIGMPYTHVCVCERCVDRCVGDGTGLCYVRNDYTGEGHFVGTVTINATSFATSEVTTLKQVDLDFDNGQRILWFRTPDIVHLSGSAHILEAVVQPAPNCTGISTGTSVIPLAIPADMQLQKSHITASAVHLSHTAAADEPCFAVDIAVDAVSVYATVTTLADGFFAENAGLVHPPGKRVPFIGATTLGSNYNCSSDAFKVFSSSLRVEDVSTYL